MLWQPSGVRIARVCSTRKPEAAVVPDLFDTHDRAKENRLQRVLDRIEDRQGKRAIIYGSQLASDKTVYKNEHKSPLYTTDIRDIITLKA